MEKNKTGKYLKYAIGEIVLVVIGILIALSINNWNENRKSENFERIYLENIKSDPFIIFCTAYDKYAIKAFEKNTIDYLLKPLDKARFDQAINRAIDRIGNDESNFMHILEDLTTKSTPAFSNNLFVQKSEKLVNLPVQSIVHLEASKDYTIISTNREQYVSSTGISKLEEKLDPEIFIRIHRSTIINLKKLTEIEKFGSGNLAARMENGKTFAISRSYAKSIRDRIV